MKFKGYIDNLINEMYTPPELSKELIKFLKTLEKDPKYMDQAKKIREKIEQEILRSGNL